MGVSKKGHKQKHSDKETQSPLLKVFKEMIQREKSDPEKTILIKKEKQENRKKKNYSGLKQKCDDISGNSSSTDRFKSTRDPKMAQDLQQQIYNGQNQDMAHSMPFNNDKKESWWFWKDSKKRKKQSDDTCSCVSCALKKIIGSDYVCIVCLVVVFALSLGVAFFVVYNSMSPACVKPDTHVVGGSVKNEMQKARRQFRSDGENVDDLASEGRKNWQDFRDFVTNPWRSLPLAPGIEFGDSNLRDANYAEESGGGLSAALSHVLDTEKLTNVQTSEKLRDFYKRLIQTDARIKKLKTKTDASNTYNTVNDINSISVPERFKRSLMSVSNSAFYDSNKKIANEDSTIDLSKFKIYYPPYVAVRSESNQQRSKRSDDDIFNVEPSGIIIEKKKVMVQYAPFERKRNFPKCSHSPNQYKSHEKQLKHPFYRNSQRLDELLGQILDKNLDKVVSNHLNLDLLIGDRDTCKHPKQDQEFMTQLDDELRKQDTISPTKSSIEDEIKFTSVKNTDTNLDADDILKLTDIKTLEDLDSDAKSSLVDKKEVQRDEIGESDRYLLRSTTPHYDLFLSISTLINTNAADVVKISKEKSDSVIKKRKLLQLNEEDDENLGYEDFKEVLADYTDSRDENDKRVERERRSETIQRTKQKQFPSKYNIPEIYNQNWKGQMQLYPDELSYIMKQSADQSSTIDFSPAKDLPPPVKEKYENTDTEYVEDNLNNKYAKLAQAYSDYGVLDEKKEYMSNGKSTFVTEGDMFQPKFTNDEISSRKHNIKIKTRRSSELPLPHHETTKPRAKSYNPEHFSSGLNISENNSNENIYSNISQLKPDSGQKPEKGSYNFYGEPNQVFPSYRSKRSLKSIFIEELKNREVKKDDFVRKEENLDPYLIKAIKQDKFNETNVTGNKTLDGFGEILHVMSDWFLTLAKLSGEFRSNSTSQTLVNNSTKILTLAIPNLDNVTKDIIYPMYDGDMIDNIGHRSRTLLAVKENISMVPPSSANITEIKKSLQSTEAKLKGSSSKASIANTTVATIAMQTKGNFSKNINITRSDSDSRKNRTVIKRSADSKLIFWDDIYDDEYGIKVDYFNNEQRSKHSVDNQNFVKRSGQWINKKFRKLSDRFHTKSKSKKYAMKTTQRRMMRSVDDLRLGNYLQSNQNHFFGGKTTEEAKDIDNSFDFGTLTANMKQICREAVKAVQKTRTLNARQDIGGEFEATSLMQQLVRLMTDLIDFQVQQKTCAKLPPDLAEFLNWLTSPNAKYPPEKQFDGAKSEIVENNNPFPKEDVLETSMPLLVQDTPFIREGRDDPRMDLISTLGSVKDLLHKYQELNSEEKGKLPGVKEYLDKQMEFLTKQLSTYEYKEDPSFPGKLFRNHRLPPRRKRQMKTEPGDVEILRKLPEGKRVSKFVKVYGVKRTKTTASYFDSVATGNLRKKKHTGGDARKTTETTARNDVTKNVTSNDKT